MSEPPSQTELDGLAALYDQGQFVELIARAEALLARHPASFALNSILGFAHGQLARFAEAGEAFARALAIDPTQADTQNNLGLALKEQGRHDEAVAAYQRALAIEPRHLAAHNNLGLVLHEQGRLDEAAAEFGRALAVEPVYPLALNNLGLVLRDQGKLDEALAAYERALAIDPGYAHAHNNLGNLLQQTGRLDAAVEAFGRALAIAPNFASAHNNLGHVLHEQGRIEEAIAAYGRALAIDPAFAYPYNNLGNILLDQGEVDEAIGAFNRALSLKPDYFEAYGNLALALEQQGRLDQSVAAYEKALAIEPDHAPSLAHKLLLKALMCDWSAPAEFAAVAGRIGIAGRAISPFAVLAAEDHPGRHRLRSERWAEEKFKQLPVPFQPRPATADGRIRVGYFSADFHDHATMYLMAGLFRQHDRQAFEIHAYSYGAVGSGEMRARLIEQVDSFSDVAEMPDHDIVALARGHGLDIAVDLKGYTQHSRSRLFAHRLAPIQVNYLGYPGTMGAPFIDYMIADRQVVPEAQRAHYSEKIIYLPDSYQANDDRRAIFGGEMRRRDLGLAEDAFVFCCFNNNYKITPAEFDIWMRLLRQVDHGVLWLLKANEWAQANLRREAEARGVAPERLIFADKMPLAMHLARHRHADLFIDTFNFNAHTTASDALWAGLPIVTKQGEGFAARVASSLLHAIGLSELVTTSAEDYEKLALAMATDPQRLAEVKARLAANRLSTALFDTRLFTRNIEAAYRSAHERYREGREPADIMLA